MYVSYTHLDVYKRQALYSSALPTYSSFLSLENASILSALRLSLIHIQMCIRDRYGSWMLPSSSKVSYATNPFSTINSGTLQRSVNQFNEQRSPIGSICHPQDVYKRQDNTRSFLIQISDPLIRNIIQLLYRLLNFVFAFL